MPILMYKSNREDTVLELTIYQRKILKRKNE